MNVLQIPDARDGNPYQQHLVESLEEEATSVSVADPSKPYIFAILRAVVSHETDIDIVHLHWMDTFYSGDSILETAIKSPLWLLELLILRIAGYSLVWTAHNLVPHESTAKRYHYAYRRFVVTYFLSTVIAHTTPAADGIVNTYGLPVWFSGV